MSDVSSGPLTSMILLDAVFLLARSPARRRPYSYASSLVLASFRSIQL